METLLKNLAARLKAYGATIRTSGYGYGYIILGEVEIEVEINVRRVARIEGQRFLYGSRRGYDLNEMVLHILRRLPALQERAKLAKERQLIRKTHEQNEEACNDYTKMIGDDRVKIRYDRYATEGKQFSLTFRTDNPTTAMVAADMVREIEDTTQPRLLQKPQESGPMRFSFADENGDPSGNSLTLNMMAVGGIDLDKAVALQVGELMVHEDMRVLRIS